MKLDVTVIQTLRAGEVLELHGAPNSYGGRPVIARSWRDPAGMAVVQRWDDEARAWAGERGVAGEVLAREADLTGRDDWERSV